MWGCKEEIKKYEDTKKKTEKIMWAWLSEHGHDWNREYESWCEEEKNWVKQQSKAKSKESKKKNEKANNRIRWEDVK